MDAASNRLESMESELRLREREMSESESQREAMEKDVNMLKQNVKGEEIHKGLECLRERHREREDMENMCTC